ncbi:MAG: efflux RND transporter permease subunit, partial [Armatimonadota bacterium]|nr:efflux RND transporter permease subunit [Armatimonadota bacterium]
PIPSKDPAAQAYINLGDVATVADTVVQRTDIARIWSRDKSGKLRPSESVGIVVTKNNDANTIQVVSGVKDALARLQKILPGNTHFVLNLDQSKTVGDQLNDIVVALIAGSVLAVLVVFLFLHDIRGTIICAVAIPLCLIATFIPMYFAGFTLNSMTMLALSLVVGILVDDSIVVLENIHRHLSRGELPSEAAYNGRSEIGLAAVSITLVDVAVFLPMAWMGGIVGQFFRQFGLTVACATLFSLVVSFSVTPMLASRLYHSSADVDHVEGSIASRFEGFYSSLDDHYRHLLGWCLRSLGRRLLIIFGGWALLFIVFGVVGPHLGFQFTPVTDQGQLVVTSELSTGASLGASDQVARLIESRIAVVPEVDTLFTSVGSISGSGSSIPQLGPQYAQISVNLIDKPSVLQSLNPFYHGAGRRRADVAIAVQMRKLLADIPGAKIVVIPVSGFGGATAPVDIELLGLNLEHMQNVALQMKTKLLTVPGVMNPDISLRPGKPEAEVIVDRTKAAVYGYSVSQIGEVVRTAFSGNNDSKYREQGDEFGIRIELRDLDRASTSQIGNLIVGSRGASGHFEPVYLNDVANIVMGSGPTQLDRLDRQRVVHVSAYLAPDKALGNMQGVINKAIGSVPLGNIQLVWGGQAERMKTEGGYLLGSLVLSIILVYLLMAALFDSLLYPLVIQFSVPMALIGAIIALVITGKTMSIIAMIGVIMLVGLVQKNAILLIDYTNTLRARGMERNAAVQQAGATRLRPILMTTVAMVFGMMPIALGIGRS